MKYTKRFDGRKFEDTRETTDSGKPERQNIYAFFAFLY